MGRNVENLRKNIENKVVRLIDDGIKFRKANVTNGNVDLILKFDLEHSQKIKENTRMGYLTCLYCLAQFLGRKPFKKVSKYDLLKYFEKMKRDGIKEGTYNQFYNMLLSPLW